MSDFNVRSDSVDVEQIMEQIRVRIREKRGVDYTDQQLRELAAVKLEKVLDPRGVRSDLLARFKERQPQYQKPQLPLYTFEDTTIYETHRGPLQFMRRMLLPLLKLLFNPNPIIHAFHAQAEINRLNLEREEAQEKRRIEMETLYYEIIHNLVFELTRTGIEVKNLKMQVEAIGSRLEFNERRSRALESAVVYKPSGRDDAAEPVTDTRQNIAQSPSPAALRASVTSSPPPFQVPSQAPSRAPLQPASGGVTPPSGAPLAEGGRSPASGRPAEGPGQRSRRRRRRRGRRSGPPASVIMGASVIGVPPPDVAAPGALASDDDEAGASEPEDQEAVGLDDHASPRGISEQSDQAGALALGDQVSHLASDEQANPLESSDQASLPHADRPDTIDDAHTPEPPPAAAAFASTSGADDSTVSAPDAGQDPGPGPDHASGPDPEQDPRSGSDPDQQ